MKQQLQEAVELFEEVIIYGTERVLKSIDSPIIREFSPEQIQMMKIISKHSPLSAGGLAVMQGVHKSAISNRLKKLEEKGFVRIVKSSEDQRTKLVALTDQGEEFVEKAKETLYDFISSLLLDHVEEEEVEQFVTTFRKLKDIMKLGDEEK